MSLRTFPLFVAFFIAAGCSSAPVEDQGVDEQDGQLIGGRAAGPRYAAVGALAESDGSVFCTATLVTPRFIITAQHCIEGGSEEEPADHVPAEVTFRLGARAASPERKVALKRWLPVPTFDAPDTLVMHFASDVALAELAEPITDRAPIPISTHALGAAEIGKPFDAVGFGVRSKSGRGEVGGRREVGTFALEAVEGNAFLKRFGSKEGFARHLSVIDPQGAEEGVAERLIDDGELHAGYEVLARSERSETCFSDSGGPLLRDRNGKLEVVGVVSRGFPGYSSSCTHLGTVFAVFGPKTAPFLASSQVR